MGAQRPAPVPLGAALGCASEGAAGSGSPARPRPRAWGTRRPGRASWAGSRANLRSVLCPQHNMPFWRISCHADLEALRHALELEYL